jgi:hypothetical protein
MSLSLLKKVLFLTTFLVFSSYRGFCQTNGLTDGWWWVFDGTLDKQNIRMALYFIKNGDVEGNYLYKKYDKKIHLVGHIGRKHTELKELIDEKINGFFISDSCPSSASNDFIGTWFNGDKSKSYPFKLSLESGSIGDSDLFYSGCGISNERTEDDVGNFMKHLKASILDSDKEWIANHTYYPIKVYLSSSNKNIELKNASQMIIYFNDIFNPDFKEIIKNEYTSYLFHNYMGIMLGNGEIWINATSSNKFGFRITAINNSPSMERISKTRK